MALTDNIVAYYKLEGNSNDPVAGNNGTDTAITYVAGKIGQGASMVTATPSYIQLPAGAQLTGDFTFSAWINPNTVTPANTETELFYSWTATPSQKKNFICQQYNNTLKFYNGNGTTGQDTAVTGGTLSASTWQHVVFTRSTTTHKIYLNGSEVATATQSYSGGSGCPNPTIGCSSDKDAGYGFGGVMDEIGIWSRALTATEIQQIYQNGRGYQYPFGQQLNNFEKIKADSGLWANIN